MKQLTLALSDDENELLTLSDALDLYNSESDIRVLVHSYLGSDFVHGIRHDADFFLLRAYISRFFIELGFDRSVLLSSLESTLYSNTRIETQR
jgi:hypothetical protein